MSYPKSNYLSKKALSALKLKKIGRNVLISKDARIYSPSTLIIGDNTRIDDFCILSGNIKIGNNVHFAPHCVVSGKKSLIEFCDYSGLAFGCRILGVSDDYSGKSMTNPTVNSEYKNLTDLPVYIGKHVIIGANSVVMPGCKMDEGSALGAMSLLTKNVESYEIYFGAPAKKLKNRSQLIKEIELNFRNTRNKLHVENHVDLVERASQPAPDFKKFVCPPTFLGLPNLFTPDWISSCHSAFIRFQSGSCSSCANRCIRRNTTLLIISGILDFRFISFFGFSFFGL